MIQHVQYVIELELYKSIDRIHAPLVVRVGENDSQRITAKIKRHGEFLDIDCDSARLDIIRENGTWARVDATVDGYTVTCDLPSKAIASAGTARLAYFVFIKGDQVQTTENFALRIEDAATENAESDAYFDISVNHIAEKWKAFEAAAEQIESDRQSAESERTEAESARVQAESARDRAEASRDRAEDARKENESERIRKENERIQHDTRVMRAESGRVNAEQARVAEETSRTEAENERKRNESTRKTNESARVTEEQARKTRFTQMMDAAQNIKFKIVEANESGVPKGEGVTGVIYLVRGKSDSATNHYTEWIWYDGKWELFGTSGATVEPITPQDIDKVAQDGTISGTRVLSATALNYLWTKLKARYQTSSQVSSIVHSAYDSRMENMSSSIQALTSRVSSTQSKCERLDDEKASQSAVSDVRDEVQSINSSLSSRMESLSNAQQNASSTARDALNKASRNADSVSSLKTRLSTVETKFACEDVRYKIHVSQGWWVTNYIRATKIGSRVFLNFRVERASGSGTRYDMKPWEEELLFSLDSSIKPTGENILFPAMTNMYLYNNSNGMQMIKVCPSGIKLMCSAEIDIAPGNWIGAYCSWEIDTSTSSSSSHSYDYGSGSGYDD